MDFRWSVTIQTIPFHVVPWSQNTPPLDLQAFRPSQKQLFIHFPIQPFGLSQMGRGAEFDVTGDPIWIWVSQGRLPGWSHI